jgi:hypothetical protein
MTLLPLAGYFGCAVRGSMPETWRGRRAVAVPLSSGALELGYAVKPVAEQGPFGSGKRREVGERGAQGHCRGRRSRNGGGPRVGEYDRADRFPRRVRERVVALVLGLVDKSKDDAGAGRAYQVDRPSLGHAQPSRLGDPVYPCLQDPGPSRGGGPAPERRQNLTVIRADRKYSLGQSRSCTARVRREQLPDADRPAGVVTVPRPEADLNPHDPDLREPATSDTAQALPNDIFTGQIMITMCPEARGLPIAHAIDISLTTAFALNSAR